MAILLELCPFYAVERVALVVVLDCLGTLKVTDRFPGVVAFGVSFPLDKVLQLSFSPLTLVAEDGLDFVLFFIFHKVRGRP
jgi:hypothetical protein